ncbi:MAG: Do family serine endopeptidase [Alphaproteobacteria bacterium]|nr:Do family serine endopeptidase [Alphaproteobacteria bacterium]
MNGPLRTAALTMVAATVAIAGSALAPGDAAAQTVQSQLRELQGADYSEGYAPLVNAVMPAVVAVRVERQPEQTAQNMPFQGNPSMREFFERFFGDPEGPGPGPDGPPRGRPQMGLGSGFIISEDGLVVTNAHVVGDATDVEVQLDDERTFDAEVRGVDPLTDLALLEIDPDQPLPYVTFGDSDEVQVGDRVVAIGNPFGLGGSVTSGIVSALSRRIGAGPYDDFLQIDAPINRGNSGGPTFDLEGNVVGVNTAIFSPSGGSIGIGFAIASNLARDVVADLRDDGQVSRGWLGVGIQDLEPQLARELGLDQDTSGTVVTQVQPQSPADRAGFQTGDVITALNGETVEGAGALSREVAALDPGDSATFTVVRGGDQQQLEVDLAERPRGEIRMGQGPGQQQPQEPDDSDTASLGLALAPLSEEVRRELGIPADQGVAVRAVEPGGPAAEAGLREGDVILEIGREPVASPQEAAQRIARLARNERERMLLLINRGGGQRFVTVPLDIS